MASVRAARTLRREGFDGTIQIVGAEASAPYNRPPLSKELLRDDLPDDLVLAEPPSWFERRRVAVRTGTRVVALDLARQRAEMADGDVIGFERCLLATGAEPIQLPVPGGERAIYLRTLADARRLRAAAKAMPTGAPVAVVGGGFIGVEVASGLAALGLRPVIAERAGALWSGGLGEVVGDWAIDQLHDAGVEVRLGAAVETLEDGGPVIAAARMEAAFTVAGIGVRPATALAEAAGLEVDGGIVTDAAHRTSHPSVWAAGDVARVAGVRVEHWHAARDGGERAALSMLGVEIPPARVPWVFTEVAGTPVDVIGLAQGWDGEAWVRPDAVAVLLEARRVVQLTSIDSALDVETARTLVADGASIEEVEAAVAR